MELAELRNQTHINETLTPELWAEAVILGLARTLVRDEDREEHRDRGGARRNTEIDLMGAMGEILLYSAVERCRDHEAALENMCHHLFVHRGKPPPASQADLDFENAGDDRHRIRIDAKTFDCSLQQPKNPTRRPYPNRLFAINKDKHNALRGNCEYYYCALFARRGRTARVSYLVEYPRVETKIILPAGRWKDGPRREWFICDIAYNNDPSHNIHIDDFIDENFQPGHRPDPAELRQEPYSRLEVLAAVALERCQQSVVRKAPQLAAILPEVLQKLSAEREREQRK